MCYSAQIWADYRRYVRAFGAILSVSDFVDLFLRRLDDPRIKIPKAMEAAFAEPVSAPEQTIRDAIDQFNTLEATRLEQQLFAQRKRLAEAERALVVKVTQTATSNKRIAAEKIEPAMSKLADLRRREFKPRDSRVFPGH